MSLDKSAMGKWNSESAIMFMQQEHAATLKALHEEIEDLQKKCADLTFQLTMQGLTIDESGNVGKGVQKVQEELEQSKEKVNSLEKELSNREKKILQLEMEMKSQRKRWLDENRVQLQKMHSLQAELEAKDNNNIYLTGELKKLKQKIKSDQPEPGGMGSSSYTNSNFMLQGGHAHFEAPLQTVKRSVAHQHYFPVPPPKDKTASFPSGATRLRRSNKLSANAGKGISASNAANSDPAKQPNQLLVSPGRSSGSESPDISPFLPTSNQDIPVIEVSKPPVLPPISANSATLSSVHPVIMRHMVSPGSHYPQKKKNLSSKTELVSLAVENAVNSEASWKLAESRSSEYN